MTRRTEENLAHADELVQALVDEETGKLLEALAKRLGGFQPSQVEGGGVELWLAAPGDRKGLAYGRLCFTPRPDGTYSMKMIPNEKLREELKAAGITIHERKKASRTF